MNRDSRPKLVSVHGGHSGEFCNHAKDTLEEMINSYITQGFVWVGITEHMPPLNDSHLFSDEIAAGLNAQKMYERFSKYIETCRGLQKKHASSIEVLVGFETEFYTGCQDFVRQLIREFQPDYIVGSLHHVNDIVIDSTPELYLKAAKTSGSIEALYCRYFDQQFDLIDAFQPAVLGHFDLIRKFDDDYPTRLKNPDIQQRIRRNLERVRELDIILDFNVAALRKGANEPYISRPILLKAHELGVSVIPGDDSHGVDSIGLHVQDGIEILQEIGFDIQWRRPAIKK